MCPSTVMPLIGFINDIISVTASAHAERAQRCCCSQILPITIYHTLYETSPLPRSLGAISEKRCESAKLNCSIVQTLSVTSNSDKNIRI